MRKLAFISALTTAILLSSCGGSKKTDDKTTGDSTNVTEKSAKDVCTYDNKITITVKDYTFGMKSAFNFETTNFEVKQSSWKYKNDSTGELKLSNYKQEELIGDRKDEQIDIIAELKTKKGEKLKAGEYLYQDYESSLNSKVNLITSKGKVYWNWVMGMPKQGSVTVDFVDKENICGKFDLNVEKPDNKTIGTVRMNGTFKISK
jgi:hypothetical protein